MRFISYKYQTPNNLAKYQYFYTRHFISLRHFEKNGALHCKLFSKHPLFTTFSLFLKVSEVCNISSKCWLPNKSANKIFLQKTPYTPSFFYKNLLSPSQNLLETFTFTTFLLVLAADEVCAIFQINNNVSII